VIFFINIAYPIISYSMAQNEILSSSRRSNRICLDEAKPLDGLLESSGPEQ
jgi:hypothetical protein